MVDLASIAPGTYRRLRRALLTCAPFESDSALRAMFVDARIRVWRDAIPQAESADVRVRKAISFLWDHYNDAGENALILFLQASLDLIEPGDACHETLATLIEELHSQLQSREGIDSGRDTESKPSASLATKPQFVNRHRELELLSPQRLCVSRSPYFLISAPTGYGKSTFLRYLVDLVYSAAIEGTAWCVRYIDCCDLAEAQVIRFAEEVMGNTWQEDIPPTDEQVIDCLEEIAYAGTSSQARPLLLIFDGLDVLVEEKEQWLCDFLEALYHRTRYGDQELLLARVILAARNVDLFWAKLQVAHPDLPIPAHVPFGPFDTDTIQALIRSTAQVALNESSVTQIAEEVRYLTGGHPQISCALVDELCERRFGVGSVSRYLARNRQRIIHAYVSPVVLTFLSGLMPDLQKAIRVLAVFRRVNANTVQALVEAGLLTEGTDEVALLGRMQNARLLDKPTIRDPFYRDTLMRRVLLLDLEGQSEDGRATYRHLNAIARELYARWMHNAGPGGVTYFKDLQRVLSLVEWLFHALQDDAVKDEGIRQEFHEHLDAISPPGDMLSVGMLIVDEIKRDSEIKCLLRQRLGTVGVAEIEDWLLS